MSHSDDLIRLELRDVIRIQDELRKQKDEQLLDTDSFIDSLVKKWATSLAKGQKCALYEKHFTEFCDFLKVKNVFSAEVHIVHHTDSKKDILAGQHILIQPVKEHVGVLPLVIPSPLGLMRVSKFARLVSRILTEMEPTGIILVAGAGIDPIVTGIDLDDYVNASPLKRYLGALLCVLGLFQPKESFETPIKIASLTKESKNVGVITANWSYSLERSGIKRDQIKNIRRIKKRRIDNKLLLDVGEPRPLVLPDFVKKIGGSLVFLIGTSLRPSDYLRTGMEGVLMGADYILVNCNHDYLHRKFRTEAKEVEIKGYSGLFQHYTELKGVRGKSIPFLKIIENANSLFKEVEFPWVQERVLR